MDRLGKWLERNWRDYWCIYRSCLILSMGKFVGLIFVLTFRSHYIEEDIKQIVVENWTVVDFCSKRRILLYRLVSEQNFYCLLISLSATYTCHILKLRQLIFFLHRIQQQYASFGGGVRLAKRWVSSHMLAAYFPEECIELIMAYIYLHPSPQVTPA